MPRAILTLALVLLAAASAPAQNLEPLQRGDFDQYVLALSWQPGFCQMVHENPRAQCDGSPPVPLECTKQPEHLNRAQYLTVHGLWPGLPDSLARRKQVTEAEWRSRGCATAGRKYPAVASNCKCSAPEILLRPETLRELAVDMPGANEISCLPDYEYSKHGVCFGFDPDIYFLTAVRLNREIRGGTMGRFLRENYGRTVRREALLEALVPLLGPAALTQVEVRCNKGPGGDYLTEIRIPLRKDAVNAPLSPTSLGQMDVEQNCSEFRLDARGF